MLTTERRKMTVLLYVAAKACSALRNFGRNAENRQSILPSPTSSAIPPTLSSTGTFGSTRDMQKTSSASMAKFFKLCSQVRRR
jgi:hypothetical protein